MAIQMNHHGAVALPNPELGSPAGPSPVSPPNGDMVPRELSIEEMRHIVKAFAQAARRLKEAGFDAVEIHSAHGYLGSQFTSPITNRRTDRYGGSLGNRLRLLLEIVAEVRQQVGSDYPLLCRLGAMDMVEGGLTAEDGQHVAAALAEAGVSVIDVSVGFVGADSPEPTGQGYYVPLAEGIRRAVEVPVIGVGGITEPEFADRVVRQGRVDLVAVGTAILNDPQWAAKAVETLSRGGSG